jgi:sugar-specific transcriptional regulator TrmB
MVKQAIVTEEIAVREDLVSRLVALGLTSHPAKTLLALLENPGIPASKICELTGIPDSKIYQALEDLDRKWNLIEVRKGNPSLYRALDPDQIFLNLKRVADKEHTTRLLTLDQLKKRIEPLTRLNPEPGELEIAYIVKGQQNILNRLKNTVEQAQREIQLLTYEQDILHPLLPVLAEAKKKRIHVKLAVTSNLERELEMFGSVKNLVCKCNLLLVDDSKLVSVSNWGSDKPHALVTEDEAMTTVAREYYDNPRCCC